MVDKKSPKFLTDDKDLLYEITIKGHIDEHWTDWLGGLKITWDANGNSLLTGIVPDQAALHGILMQIRDLGLGLISLKSKTAEGKTPKPNE